jgi:hypothetical protein
MPPWAVFAYPLIPLPRSSRQQSCRNGFFLSSPVSLAGAVGLIYRRKVTHAFTADGVLSDSRTNADSVEARGVRSGTMTWRTDLSDSSFAHQGMALKCATGSAVGWLCADLGFEDILRDCMNEKAELGIQLQVAIPILLRVFGDGFQLGDVI